MNLRTAMLIILAVAVALAGAVAIQASPKDTRVVAQLVVFEGMIAFPFVAIILRVLSGRRPQ